MTKYVNIIFKSMDTYIIISIYKLTYFMKNILYNYIYINLWDYILIYKYIIIYSYIIIILKININILYLNYFNILTYLLMINNLFNVSI